MLCGAQMRAVCRTDEDDVDAESLELGPQVATLDSRSVLRARDRVSLLKTGKQTPHVLRRTFAS